MQKTIKHISVVILYFSFAILPPQNSFAASKCTDTEWQLSLKSVHLLEEDSNIEKDLTVVDIWSDEAYLSGLFDGSQSFEIYTTPETNQSTIRFVIEESSDE